MNDQQQQAQREMPRYRCHKEVWALKIARVDAGVDQFQDSWIITPEDAVYAPFEVSSEWLRKHNPVAGGYFVVYPGDGYKSFSPAKAFEEGYTRITPDNAA